MENQAGIPRNRGKRKDNASDSMPSFKRDAEANIGELYISRETLKLSYKKATGVFERYPGVGNVPIVNNFTEYVGGEDGQVLTVQASKIKAEDNTLEWLKNVSGDDFLDPTDLDSLLVLDEQLNLWKRLPLTNLKNKTSGAITTRTMTLVSCGNSISVQNQNTATGLPKGLQLANIISGSPFEWKRMTASTRTDIYGTYGYSGATLETILGDLEAQWFTPLATAGIIPDVAFGYALLENDLIQNRTLAQMKSSLNAWIATVKNRWQGVKILLNTPHPTTSYNTPTIKQNYTDITAYIMSLDNGVDIFCTKLDGYLSPSIVGNPIVNNIVGSISGTTLTVISTDININVKDIITIGAYSGRITAYVSGSGGAGTYTLDTSGTVAQTNIFLNKFASDGVHPNTTGSLVNARSIKNTIARLGSVWKRNYIGFSNNMAVYGSIAAQSPGVGTVATSMDTSILPGTNTYVCQALLPGYQETCTTPSNSGPSYPAVNWLSMGSFAISGVTQMSPFAVIELVEGAENLKNIVLAARVNDGGGNTFQYFLNPTTNDTECTWQNGDVLTFVYPPIIANSGSITSLTNYIQKTVKMKGGVVKYKVLSQGYYKIS